MNPGEIEKHTIPRKTGKGASEYRLLIWPGKSVMEKIERELALFFTHYEMSHLQSPKPAIQVAGFLASEQMEETLIRWIHRICINQPAFRVALNNYGGFPPHILYLRIQDTEPFLQLQKKLRAIDDFIEMLANQVGKPYLSFTEGLPEKSLKKPFPGMRKKHFMNPLSSIN